MPRPLDLSLAMHVATAQSEPFVRTLARVVSEDPAAPMLTFGDTTKAFNKGDRNKVVALIGIGLTY